MWAFLMTRELGLDDNSLSGMVTLFLTYAEFQQESSSLTPSVCSFTWLSLAFSTYRNHPDPGSSCEPAPVPPFLLALPQLPSPPSQCAADLSLHAHISCISCEHKRPAVFSIFFITAELCYPFMHLAWGGIQCLTWISFCFSETFTGIKL